MTHMTQSELTRLREVDPLAWLRDKAERGVAIDARGPLNRVAVLKVCDMAEAGRRVG